MPSPQTGIGGNHSEERTLADDQIVLTGVKPTGSPHIGNLLSAIEPGIALAADDTRTSLFFIADYHALTTVRDPEVLKHQTYAVAATWLAFGLDVERTMFYRQSDIPEVFELAWILSCYSPKGYMNKSHAYKARVQDNAAQGSDGDAGVNVGLFTYPILMAADILLFDAHTVPVGKDQVQHVEIARDIAQRLNHACGADVLRLPKAEVSANTATVPGLDGRKMSKSYGNVVPLFETSKRLRKIILRIKTDSTPPEAPKDPESSLVYQIHETLLSADQKKALADRYRAGISWGEAKVALYEEIESRVAEPRERYEYWMSHTDELDQLLRKGAQRARPRAQAVLQRVRDALGITAAPVISS